MFGPVKCFILSAKKVREARPFITTCVGDLYPSVEKASLKKKKMTLTIAWGGQGVVLVDGCKGENRINSDYFCNTVLSSIQQWARKTRPTTGISSFLIHMDNAPCHNSRSTKEYLRQYNFNRLEHPLTRQI